MIRSDQNGFRGLIGSKKNGSIVQNFSIKLFYGGVIFLMWYFLPRTLKTFKMGKESWKSLLNIFSIFEFDWVQQSIFHNLQWYGQTCLSGRRADQENMKINLMKLTHNKENNLIWELKKKSLNQETTSVWWRNIWNLKVKFRAHNN